MLVDDHPQFLAEISDFLSAEFEIVGTANDGAALLEVTERTRPDVVVTDLQMPNRAGSMPAARSSVTNCHCRHYVTVCADIKLTKMALSCVIQGFILKLHAGEDLIPAIEAGLNIGSEPSRRQF